MVRTGSGVDSIEIDMAMQKVTVTGWAEQKKVLKAVRKTGRRAELWSLPYNPEHQSGGDYFNVSQHRFNGPLTHFNPQPSSYYNYYKHGYDSHDHGSHYRRLPQSTIFSHHTGSAFSDENPTACSIMWSITTMLTCVRKLSEFLVCYVLSVYI